jgi:hypothetical protein
MSFPAFPPALQAVKFMTSSINESVSAMVFEILFILFSSVSCAVFATRIFLCQRKDITPAFSSKHIQQKWRLSHQKMHKLRFLM